MTHQLDAKLILEDLSPSRVFWVFFLYGPAFAALLQLLLLNLSLFPALVTISDPFQVLLVATMEVSGMMEAILVFLFGLPASLLIAVCATSSYLILRRVDFLVVAAAVLSVIWLEGFFAPDFYTGYLASYGVSGSWQSGAPAPTPRRAVVLCWVLHVFPAFICWWLVRKKRLPPL
jgi:hypothetical protein